MTYRTVTLTVRMPEIVADCLDKALAESETVVICPNTIYPGYTGIIVQPESRAEHDAELDAQWADVEAGEAHLRDTDPERTHQ